MNKTTHLFSLLTCGALALTTLACDEAIDLTEIEAQLELEEFELEEFERQTSEVQLELELELELDGVNLEDYEFVLELDNLKNIRDPYSLDVRERWGIELEDGMYLIQDASLYRLRDEVPDMPRFSAEELASPGVLRPGELHGEAAEWANVERPLAAPSAAQPSPEGGLTDVFAGAQPEQVPAVQLGNTDDRTQVSTPNSWYPARSVGNLSGCTATLIGPRHAITAAHCINGGGSVTFVPGQNGNGTAPNGSYTSTHILLRVASNALLDYGLIGLPNNSTLANLGWLGLYWFGSTSSYNGKYVYLKGYPSSGSGFQWEDKGNINRNAQATGNYGILYYPLDTSGGQSGSAIYHYINGVAAVLAVHKRGNEGTGSNPCTQCDYTSDPADQNVGARITSTVYNDLCWMMSVVGPSSFADHPCTD